VIRRYERDRPGELIHVDVRKLDRIPDGGGHKVLGRQAGRARRSSVGFGYVHFAVDDHSRLAYSEIHEDEKAATCAAFLRRAAAFFAAAGIERIERVLTDNAWPYRKSFAWQQALADLGTAGKLTRAYRPQTNGKVERFNRTLLDEWAYPRPYTTNTERTDALADFLHTYNHHRCHTALEGKPPISDVAAPVELFVEGRWPPALAAAPQPVADLVGPLGGGVAEAALSQPGADGFGAVALVDQDMGGPHAGPSRTRAGHPYRFHHGGELGAVVGVPACDGNGERAAEGVAGEMNLAGQAASGASESRASKPPFRAPAACWWARTMVESTDTSQSTLPAASACPWAALSIHSKVPSAAHRRKRVCSVAHGPYRSGTSRQALPVRNFHTIPLRTLRSSDRFRPLSETGSSGRTNSHSTSDSSWRRIAHP
jgi:hypothetical protein